MNTSKRIFALLIALTLMLTTGCGQNNETSDTNTTAESYIEKAQKYVDEKDYATAIDILQLGLEATGDELLEEMLTEVIELQAAESTEKPTEMDNHEAEISNADAVFDLSRYASSVTYWSTEDITWVYGGYVLSITLNEHVDGIAHFEFSLTQSAPASRVAVIEQDIPISEVTSNKVSFDFDDDWWGNSGTVEFSFDDDTVSYIVNDVGPCSEMWGFFDDTGILVSNPNVYDDLAYTEAEYNALYGIEQEPVYDTSKASGILASLGMTEEEFKASCIPLRKHANDIVIQADVYFYELLKNPNDYFGNFYVIRFVKTEGIYEFNDGFIGYLFDRYSDASNFSIFVDRRDDIYSPTITGNDMIDYAYVIFDGVRLLDDKQCLQFSIIAIEDE